jgi:O-antigen/teichoic acid export membrane protein
LGQALITNSDFILVKTFFDSFDAGLYAAISVIGRIVYFGTLPLTVIVVPIIARKQALGESTKSILLLLMGGGIALCGSLFVASALFAPQILTILYGDAYVTASPLLPIYTIAAALFVLTNLLVTYRVALGRGSETWMPFLAGIVQILGVIIFHETLQQVITVQIATMTILFLGVAWRARH